MVACTLTPGGGPTYRPPMAARDESAASRAGTPPADPAGIHDVLARFHQAFAAGDAPRLSRLFAPDAQLLLLHQEPLEGRGAILAHWSRLFGAWDTSAWRTTLVSADVHGDRAYTLSTYSETLVPRGDGPSRRVVGRLVLFFRREPGGPWQVSLALNSHIRPIEEIAASA
jgi:uncharacterized protein (TIGR02246 family)